MAICWNCPHCKSTLSVAGRKVGASVNCPTCKKALTVPGISERRFHAALIVFSLLVLATGALGFYLLMPWMNKEDASQHASLPEPVPSVSQPSQPELKNAASPAIPASAVAAPAPNVRTETPATAPAEDRPAPAPPTVELAPAPTEVPEVAEAQPRKEPSPAAARPPVEAKAAPMSQRAPSSEEELRDQLRNVPEADFYPTVEKLHQAVASKAPRGKNLADDAKLKALRGAGTSPLEFSTRINALLLKEARAAGLSVVSDGRARITANSAKTMQHISTTLRTQGFLSAGPIRTFVNPRTGKTRITVPAGAVTDPATGKVLRIDTAQANLDSCDRFQKWCDENRVEKYSGSLPTLVQMLQVEDEPMRQLMVRELAKVPSRDASYFLAKRALFDLSPEMRKAAVDALKKRKPETYRAVFLAGLRYPWAPVADHAAEALVQLKDQGAVHSLVTMLDQPDPSLASYNERTKSYSKRELVKINHMRNCYLCHAASLQTTDLVRGLVPTPGQPLPRLYYAGQRGDFVRAEITYLHQDFSMLQTVPSPEPWPAEQRYDYTTRVRKATPEEIEEVKTRPADASYPQREAVLTALRQLTGQDTKTTVADWKQIAKPAKDAPKDAPKSMADPHGELALDLLSRGFERK